MKVQSEQIRNLNRRLATVSEQKALEMIKNELQLEEQEAQEYYKGLKRKNKRGFVGIGVTFVLVGLLLMGWSLWNTWRVGQINQGIETTGRVSRVVKITTGEASKGLVRGYRHTFVYEIDGERIKIRSRADTDTRYAVDSEIPILVSTKRPRWAEVRNPVTGKAYAPPRSFGWSLLLIVAGSLALAAVQFRKK